MGRPAVQDRSRALSKGGTGTVNKQKIIGWALVIAAGYLLVQEPQKMSDIVTSVFHLATQLMNGLAVVFNNL